MYRNNKTIALGKKARATKDKRDRRYIQRILQGRFPNSIDSKRIAKCTQDRSCLVNEGKRQRGQWRQITDYVEFELLRQKTRRQDEFRLDIQDAYAWLEEREFEWYWSRSRMHEDEWWPPPDESWRDHPCFMGNLPSEAEPGQVPAVRFLGADPIRVGSTRPLFYTAHRPKSVRLEPPACR